MNFKRSLQITTAFAALTLASTASHAGGGVNSYGNLAAPGVYYGSGNSNGDWTINTGNSGELGLRAKERFGFLLNGSNGTYTAAAGSFSAALPALATWNFDFSVNNTNTPGYVYRLGIDLDPSANTSFSYINLSAIAGSFKQATAPYKGFQESWNRGFSFLNAPGSPFDVNAPGLYSFTLESFSVDGATLTPANSVSMTVQVGAIPEPETYALMLAGLGFLGFVARRRAKQNAA